LELMETSRARVKLVILDACRDNPLARSLVRSIRAAGRSTEVGLGLAQIDAAAATGTLIAYATNPGNVADDGTGRNSPFTASLLQWIGEPGLEIRSMFGRVRKGVLDATNQQQVPWVSESIVGEYYLRPPQTAAATPEPPATGSAGAVPPAAAARRDTGAFELAFWNSIEDSDDPARWPSPRRRASSWSRWRPLTWR
jgi:uncharacterized caspase-like protein